jgi:outer membrane protein OmpA-like peptidoglycan-associated protein
MLKKFTIASLLLAVTFATNAQNVKLYKPGEALDPEEIAEILRSPMKMRGIKMQGDAGPGQTVLGEDAQPMIIEEKKSPSALALPVQFAFDSATILPDALPQLDAVAEGIKLLDQSAKVAIEGHTDRYGKENYNRTLSLRRAEAVKVYLMQKHGIEPAKFSTAGKGFNEPYNQQNPYAGENRRVQFRGGA